MGNPLVGRNPFNPLGNAIPAAQQPPEEVPTEMYGLPLPSPELLVPDQIRTWTSLTGHKDLAAFDRLLAPGFLRLKKSDGTTNDYVLVNFSRADIDYVKQALQNDMARPIFPEGSGFQSLTPEDVAKGYRVWTDRKKVPLVGKFVAVKLKNVVIEVNGEEREYPKLGLSEADLSWVDGEVRRRSEAAAAARQASAGSNSGGSQSNPGGSQFGRSRFSSFGGNSNSGYAASNPMLGGGHGEGGGNPTASQFGAGRPRTSPFPSIEYKFQCENCGKTWTDSSPISRCSECAGKYHFHCTKCGHKWTRTDTSLSKCPMCSEGRESFDNSGSNSASNPLASSGLK